MKALIPLTVIAALLAGCATSPADHKVLTGQVEKKKDEIQELLTARNDATDKGVINHSNGSYMPLRKIVKTERDVAQAKTDNIQIEINQTFTSLNDVASIVTSLTGLPVFISSDTASPVTAQSTGLLAPTMPAGAPAAGGMQVPALTQGAAQMGQMGGPSAATPYRPITTSSPFTTNYAGSLTGFMNLAATYYGLSWKPEAAGMRIYLLDSKTFRINALPGDTRLSSSVDSGSNASTGGSQSGTQNGTSTNSTGVTFTGLNVWTAMESAIKQMLDSRGKVTASPATGTITVTDTPNVLSRVTEYINDQNKALNRQVTVNVRVLSVALDDADSYGINWDAVYADLGAAGGSYAVALKTAFPTTTGAASMVLSAPSTSQSQWAGSRAIFSALSTQGRVSELTSATLITLNNQAAPVNVGRRVSYLASSTITAATVPGGVPTITLNPGSVQTGFSMSLVPHIIDGKEMLLQYSIDLSTLLQLATITSGSASIQTPDVSTSNFIQRIRIQSGETLVVAGFDQDRLSAVAQGVGSAQNIAMGNRNGTAARSMLVILIQPNLSM